jgi:hypothetical protein
MVFNVVCCFVLLDKRKWFSPGFGPGTNQMGDRIVLLCRYSLSESVHGLVPRGLPFWSLSWLKRTAIFRVLPS